MSPATALFAELDDLVGRGCYAKAADVNVELERRFGYRVAWRKTPAGPVAEVVEAERPAEGRPSSQAGQRAVSCEPAKEKGAGTLAGSGPPESRTLDLEQEGSIRGHSV